MGEMGERSDIELLRDYVEQGHEPAFRELVTRYTDLVYSAAVRQVDSADLAGDIAQSVFCDLARKARQVANQMGDRPSLAGWLHRSTRYAALNHWRDTRRRCANERQAMEQLLIDSQSAPEWERIRPLLDEALDSLDEKDREVLLLRYFKNQDFRAVGLALSISDDTAQKRAARALERVREFFSKRNVAVGASGLAVLVSANALQAAPVGLAATIATAAVGLGATVAASGAMTTASIITMTTLQKTAITVTVAALTAVSVFEAHQASRLGAENQELQRQQASLAGENEQLRRELDAATNRLAATTREVARLRKNPSELSKLRTEVGTLRQEKAEADTQNSISKALSDPETRKTIREHNKIIASGVYAKLAKNLQLTPEQTAQFNDVLADHVMDNVDLTMQALRDGKSQAEVRQIFLASQTAFEGKVQALLGDDGLKQFQDYTKNLGSTVFVTSFASNLTGDPAAVAEKSRQLLRAMEDATESVLAANGLPANYQTFVAANPGNVASEDEAAYNLQLKDKILAQTAVSASSFLTPDELTKFQQAREEGIKNAQNYILMERKLLTPVSR